MVARIILISLRLRTLVVAVAVALLVLGVWRLHDTPLDVVPEFSPVSLQVETEALGLSSS
jgi:Cu/Ag efflux pump CusA